MDTSNSSRLMWQFFTEVWTSLGEFWGLTTRNQIDLNSLPILISVYTPTSTKRGYGTIGTAGGRICGAGGRHRKAGAESVSSCNHLSEKMIICTYIHMYVKQSHHYCIDIRCLKKIKFEFFRLQGFWLCFFSYDWFFYSLLFYYIIWFIMAVHCSHNNIFT